MNRVCLCVFLYAKFFFYVTIIQTIDTGRTNRTAIIDTAKHFHLPHILTLYLFEIFVSLFFSVSQITMIQLQLYEINTTDFIVYADCIQFSTFS